MSSTRFVVPIGAPSFAIEGMVAVSTRESKSDFALGRGNAVSPSPWGLSIGDHPATLPAIIPAMTVVAPKAELDRDLPDLPRLWLTGETAVPKLSSGSYSGV